MVLMFPQAAATITVPLYGTEMQPTMPKGTILEILLNVIQRATSVWGLDAELFRPHRWLDRNHEAMRRCDLFAFSDG
jgi:cytochrome P450